MATKTNQQQIRDHLALLDKEEPRIASAFLEGINALREDAVLKDVAEKLAAGDWRGAASFLTPQRVGVSLSGMLNTLVGTYTAGAALAQAASGLQVHFNTASVASAQSWERYQQQKISQVTQETAETINQVIRRGLLEGRNPKEVARQIRSVIGLTPGQETAVANYRRALEQRLSLALQRQLRDRRFDGTVARAIANGKALSADKVNLLVQRFTEKSLKLRSQTIARTEATRAVSEGNLAFYTQAQEQGALGPGQLTKFWVVTHDDRLRMAHRAIPLMNPNGVGVDESFKSPLGAIAYPGDPTALPANTINCRCALLYRTVSR